MTIERVKLANWKCHEDLDVLFKPGLNFVLGPNGSGKSSLLQAVEFALSGRTSSTPKDSVHMASANGASVSVTLTGPGPRATFTRSIDKGGKILEAVRAEGADTRTASELIVTSFRAAPADLPRLLFLNEGDIYGTEASDTGLARYLEQLLPMQSLARLRDAASGKRRSLERLLKERRGDLRMSKEEQARLVARRSELEAELNRVEETERELLALEREHSALVHRSEAQRQARLAFAKWQESISTLLSATGIDSLRPEEALDQTERDRQVQEVRVRDLISQRGRLDGQHRALETTIESLAAASGDKCPLCEQPLTQQHRKKLLSDNRRRLETVEAELERINSDLNGAENTLSSKSDVVNTLRTALAQRPDATSDTSPALTNASDQLDRTRRELQGIRYGRRSAFEELARIRERLAAAEADRRIEAEVVDAFRKNALLEAAQTAIDSFTAEIRARLVNPLSDEVGRQWKSYRPNAPWNLVIDDRGHLAIEMLGQRRPYSSLSAGEKTVAVVLLRLALAIAFTSTDFVVLDEPLEHLDPRSRRVLISSLYHAVEQQQIGQVVVSTYEEALVRRLQQDGRAHAIYLT